MKKITLILNLIRYYGLRGFACKAWEKVVIDSRRFAIKSNQDSAFFSEGYDEKKTSLPQTHFTAPKSVFYWTHCFYPKSQGGTERFLLNLARQQRGSVRIFTLGTEKMEYYPSQILEIVYREYVYQGCCDIV